MSEQVLVTGGSGFIGAHCILQLLDAGYVVRTSVRSLEREEDVRRMLVAGGATHPERVTFVEADLLRDEGWAEAVQGCTYVHHVASPFPVGIPKDENELIVPARDGTLRVLRAARDAKVKRVVLTSSFAAIGYGHKRLPPLFDETFWTQPEGHDVRPYVRSKALAERAAWDFMEKEGGAMELSTVNPVGVFGPVLGPDYSTSIQLVQRLLEGAMPGCPRLSFGIVDVRDVADLHLRAMTHPAAKGERFLAVGGNFMTIQEIALVLKAHLGEAAAKVPTRNLPDWLLRLIALIDPGVAQIVPELGKFKNATHDKATRLLGWTPRSNEEALLATANSLLKLDLVKAVRKAAA